MFSSLSSLQSYSLGWSRAVVLKLFVARGLFSCKLNSLSPISTDLYHNNYENLLEPDNILFLKFPLIELLWFGINLVLGQTFPNVTL